MRQNSIIMLAVLLAGWSGPARTQTAPGTPRAPVGVSVPPVRATRTDTPPDIDGVLSDACWETAEPFENFTQVVPIEGAAPSERTVVRVLFDVDNLYIGIRCFDSEPQKVLGKERRRDGGMEGDDNVEIVLDSFADRRNGYYFRLSAGGARTEGLIDASKGEIRLEWDGIWYGKSGRDAEGWTAEVAIPFKTIGFSRGADTWGFNLQRTIRRKQEVDRWASPRTNSDVSRLSDAGALVGIGDIRKGLGLTVKPYVSTHVDSPEGDVDVKPGMDVFYRLTPSTTAAVTTNTDFAETEVDERIVNLTRFPIFFPEKRAFFLQDATVFSFGGLFQSPIPFYSRRIGIVGGQEKDILAGARVTGREGGFNFGFMDVQMKDDDALGKKNLSVGRVVLNVLHESTVGVIATHGDPATTGDNTVVGGDFNFRTSSVFGDQVVEAHAWAMSSFSRKGPEITGASSGFDGDDSAVAAKVMYPNDEWFGVVYVGRYGTDFHPALGFIERPGTWELDGNLRRRWRPRGFINRVDLTAQAFGYLNLDGNMQSLTGSLPAIDIEDRYGDDYEADLVVDRDVLTEPFEIHDGVVIPPGDYRFASFQTSLALAASRALAPIFVFRTGDYYTGTRTDYAAQLNWRPGSWFFASGTYQYQSVDLSEGAFIVRIVSARADVFLSPEASWSTIVQYDNASENLGLYSRVRWEVRPGQEIFLVANEGFTRVDGNNFDYDAGRVTLKVGLTFRF